MLGALACASNRAVAEVAASQPPEATVFDAGNLARSSGWRAIKRAPGIDLAVVAEPNVIAAGAALLTARAIGWTPNQAVVRV